MYVYFPSTRNYQQNINNTKYVQQLTFYMSVGPKIGKKQISRLFVQEYTTVATIIRKQKNIVEYTAENKKQAAFVQKQGFKQNLIKRAEERY